MARQVRRRLKSKYLHIIVQGINKEKIFENDYYKKLYFDLIIKNKDEFYITIIAYVIMNNHVHILLNYEK